MSGWSDARRAFANIDHSFGKRTSTTLSLTPPATLLSASTSLSPLRDNKCRMSSNPYPRPMDLNLHRPDMANATQSARLPEVPAWEDENIEHGFQSTSTRLSARNSKAVPDAEISKIVAEASNASQAAVEGSTNPSSLRAEPHTPMSSQFPPTSYRFGSSRERADQPRVLPRPAQTPEALGEEQSGCSQDLSANYTVRHPGQADTSCDLWETPIPERKMRTAIEDPNANWWLAFRGALALIDALNPNGYQMPFGTRVVNIKTDSPENILASIRTGKWAVLEKVSGRIQTIWNARQDPEEKVLFLFSINGMKRFAGFAEVTGSWDRGMTIEGWHNVVNRDGLGCVGGFPITWIFAKDVDYYHFEKMRQADNAKPVGNMWNGMQFDKDLGRMVIKKFVETGASTSVLGYPLAYQGVAQKSSDRSKNPYRRGTRALPRGRGRAPASSSMTMDHTMRMESSPTVGQSVYSEPFQAGSQPQQSELVRSPALGHHWKRAKHPDGLDDSPISARNFSPGSSFGDLQKLPAPPKFPLPVVSKIGTRNLEYNATSLAADQLYNGVASAQQESRQPQTTAVSPAPSGRLSSPIKLNPPPLTCVHRPREDSRTQNDRREFSNGLSFPRPQPHTGHSSFAQNDAFARPRCEAYVKSGTRPQYSAVTNGGIRHVQHESDRGTNSSNTGGGASYTGDLHPFRDDGCHETRPLCHYTHGNTQANNYILERNNVTLPSDFARQQDVGRFGSIEIGLSQHLIGSDTYSSTPRVPNNSPQLIMRSRWPARDCDILRDSRESRPQSEAPNHVYEHWQSGLDFLGDHQSSDCGSDDARNRQYPVRSLTQSRSLSDVPGIRSFHDNYQGSISGNHTRRAAPPSMLPLYDTSISNLVAEDTAAMIRGQVARQEATHQQIEARLKSQEHSLLAKMYQIQSELVQENIQEHHQEVLNAKMKWLACQKEDVEAELKKLSLANMAVISNGEPMDLDKDDSSNDAVTTSSIENFNVTPFKSDGGRLVRSVSKQALGMAPSSTQGSIMRSRHGFSPSWDARMEHNVSKLVSDGSDRSVSRCSGSSLRVYASPNWYRADRTRPRIDSSTTLDTRSGPLSDTSRVQIDSPIPFGIADLSRNRSVIADPSTS